MATVIYCIVLLWYNKLCGACCTCILYSEYCIWFLQVFVIGNCTASQVLCEKPDCVKMLQHFYLKVEADNQCNKWNALLYKDIHCSLFCWHYFVSIVFIPLWHLSIRHHMNEAWTLNIQYCVDFYSFLLWKKHFMLRCNKLIILSKSLLLS